jgi:hypothetical protein
MSEEIPEDIKSIFEVKPKPPEKPSFWKKQVKYLLHGFLWWLFSLIGLFVLPFVVALLILIGYIIGVIIGFMIIFLFIGFVNWIISDRLWFSMQEMTFWGVLGHGILLGILMLIVNGLTVMLPIFLSGNNIMVILATFSWGCYINGYLGKTVAKNWQEPQEETEFE